MNIIDIYMYTQKGQPQYLNLLNRKRILSLLYTLKKASRVQLAETTGLSIPTISGAIEYLESLGLVACEEMGKSTLRGGRPPALIRFPAEKNLAIGLDLDKHISHLVLTDLNANIIAEDEWKTPDGFEEIIQKTSRKIRKFTKYVPRDACFRGTGIAIAGLVNRRTGTIEYSRSMALHNIKLASMISAKVNSPVFIENEANLLALGELYYGMGNRYRNFICIDIRYGIGCGVIHNHTLLDIPAELGQISILSSESKESSPSFLALEDSASDSAMVQKAKENIQKYPGYSILQKKIDSLNPETFIKAVKIGDPFARIIFEKGLSELGLVLSGMVNIFHPETLIFHGPISENNPVFFSMLKEIIRSYALSPLTWELDLYPSSFGKRGAAVGGISLILHELLNLNPQLLKI